MIQIMKIILFNILFFLTPFVSYEQVQVLKEHKFNEGGYYILGTFSQSDRNSLRDSLGEFYTADTTILNQLKSDWIFSIPGHKYACGYHYDVFICKNGIEIESFSINLNCNEIVTNDGYFYFDSDKLRKYFGRFDRPQKENKKFDDIIKARIYRDSILNVKKLIMTTAPSWTRFEGEFDFTYKCNNNTCLEKEDSLKIVIKNEIIRKYPNEAFELNDRGGSLKEIDLTISCNKSLSDKFDLFVRNKESYFGKWRPFDLSLKSYWIK